MNENVKRVLNFLFILSSFKILTFLLRKKIAKQDQFFIFATNVAPNEKNHDIEPALALFFLEYQSAIC
jgi:hypothetical protein